MEDGLKSVGTLVLEENKEDAMLIEQATEEQVVKPLDFYEESEKNHGRHSNWKVSIFDSHSIPDTKGVLSLWSELNTVVCIQRTVVHTNPKNTKNDRCNKAYYISNRTDLTAKEFAKGIRKHWAIENGLHYEKDVVLNEDKNRIKNCNAAVVIAVFNTFAINFLRMLGFHGISDATIKFGFNFKELLFKRST